MNFKVRSYHIINGIFILLIISIFIYSLIFRKDNHPIPALLTRITGEIPPSKGLSASFSEIVRGNLDEATLINQHSLRIFAFFALQLLLRIFFSLLVRLRSESVNLLVIIDSVVSFSLFLWCFAPLIVYTVSLFTSLAG